VTSINTNQGDTEILEDHSKDNFANRTEMRSEEKRAL
jgi:hypothetical protein